MAYNTENGATFQELPEKSPISWKRKSNLLLEIEKKESKKLKSFKGYWSRWARLFSTIIVGRSRAVHVNWTRTRHIDISGNTGTIPR